MLLRPLRRPDETSVGVTPEAVYRDGDDPDVVLTLIRSASREQGEAMPADPA